MSEEVLKKKQIVKKQHYIPQFYLKQFEDKNCLIQRLDIKANKIIKPKSKKGICFDKFFYALETGIEDEVSQLVEEWLGSLEKHLSKRIPEIIDSLFSNDAVPDEDKYDVAMLMAMLYLRGPVFRRKLNEMRLSGIKQLFQMFSKLPRDKVENYFKNRYEISLTKGELNKLLNGEVDDLKFNNLLHLEMMNELRGFSNMLFGQEWLVYRNKSSYPFVTSDNPLSPERLERKNFYTGAFMDYTYHFALSPKIHIVSKMPRFVEGKKLHRKTLTEKDNDIVLRLNLYVADTCRQFVYASEISPLEDILHIITRYKEMIRDNQQAKLNNIKT